MKKIIFEDVDNFNEGGDFINSFEKYKALREIREIDKMMEFQQPGKYRVTIIIEELDGPIELRIKPFSKEECKKLKELIESEPSKILSPNSKY